MPEEKFNIIEEKELKGGRIRKKRAIAEKLGFKEIPEELNDYDFSLKISTSIKLMGINKDDIYDIVTDIRDDTLSDLETSIENIIEYHDIEMTNYDVEVGEGEIYDSDNNLLGQFEELKPNKHITKGELGKAGINMIEGNKEKLILNEDISHSKRKAFIDFQEGIYREAISKSKTHDQLMEYYDFCKKTYEDIEKMNEKFLDTFDKVLELEDQLKRSDKKGFYNLTDKFERLRKYRTALDDNFRSADTYFARAKVNYDNGTYFGMSVNLYEYFFQLRDYLWKSENEFVFPIYSILEEMKKKGYSIGDFSLK